MKYLTVTAIRKHIINVVQFSVLKCKKRKAKAEKNQKKKISKRRIYEIHRMPCRVSMIKYFLFEH